MTMTEYLKSTRHPWVCFIFLVPLVIGYELGVLWLGGDRPDTLRNGADSWLRWALDKYGFGQLWVTPLLVLGLFLIRSVYGWGSRPKEIVKVTFGMLLESAIFAGILWAISVNFRPILDRLGIELSLTPLSVASDQPLSQSFQAKLLVRYIGAGIYEEVVFRLVLFTAVYYLLRVALLPSVFAALLATVCSALIFAAAHHIGANGEPLIPLRFAFRTMAGLYFAILYFTRGFGITVGAHAGYDVLVGMAQ
jgi:membrane protease YdiL (CAAX protease family)